MTDARRDLAVDLRGRAAIVTGAGGTIGSAIARRLITGGADVCLFDVEPPATAVDGPGRVLARSLDVRVAHAVATAFAEAVRTLGRLDILVTAAGVTSPGAFAQITEDEWDRVQAINLKGVFLCNQAAIPHMRSGGFGRIVNIGSVLAKNGGNPRPWLDPGEQARAANAAYGAAKAGVHALSLYLAKELAADGITVNVVAPGPVASPMTTSLPETIRQQIPAGRFGQADEVAAAVAYLCATESGFITGEILDVNGGIWVD